MRLKVQKISMYALKISIEKMFPVKFHRSVEFDSNLIDSPITIEMVNDRWIGHILALDVLLTKCACLHRAFEN